MGPIELYDASLQQWQMPDFIKANAVVKTGSSTGCQKYMMWRPQPA
jgi:hypothetical protein